MSNELGVIVQLACTWGAEFWCEWIILRFSCVLSRSKVDFLYLWTSRTSFFSSFSIAEHPQKTQSIIKLSEDAFSSTKDVIDTACDNDKLLIAVLSWSLKNKLNVDPDSRLLPKIEKSGLSFVGENLAFVALSSLVDNA